MFLTTTLFLLLSIIGLTERANRLPVEIRDGKQTNRRIVAQEGPGTRPTCKISAENSSAKAQPEC